MGTRASKLNERKNGKSKREMEKRKDEHSFLVIFSCYFFLWLFYVKALQLYQLSSGSKLYLYSLNVVVAEGHFTISKKRTRFFHNKRILADFWRIFLENKRILVNGVRNF